MSSFKTWMAMSAADIAIGVPTAFYYTAGVSSLTRMKVELTPLLRVLVVFC